MIKDAHKFNPILKVITYLKFSTGYNEILDWSGLILGSDVIVKYNFLGIKKLIIENYNISFVILLISNIAFYLTSYLRLTKEQFLVEKKGNEQIADKQLKKKMTL